MKLRIGLLLAVGLLAGLNQACAQLSFAPAMNYAVSNNFFSVTAADVNGDGKLDLICPNGLILLTVFTNNGSGVFSSNATYSGVSDPNSSFGYVVVMDVDGDGTPDLICGPAYEAGATFTVFTNNGSGGFGYVSSSFGTSGANTGVIVATDVNGDGKLELICADAFNTVTVWTNNGSGVFSSSVACPGVQVPRGIAVGDVNGDGKVDLVAENAYEGTLSVLTNNGNGSFGSNATYTVGGILGSVAVADVNGDGKMDLIAADYGYDDNNYDFQPTNTLTVFTNYGGGVFHSAGTFFNPHVVYSNATYTVGSGPRCVIAADVNGDGKVDLICANFATNTLSVLTNNGSGGFVTAATLTVGNGPRWVTAADVNGDGKLDLICANESDNTFSVLINTSTFPSPTTTPKPNINRSSNNMRVSWPSASAGWSLQQNPDLTTANWSPSGYSGYAITDDGTNKSLVITPATGNLFFRLLHP